MAKHWLQRFDIYPKTIEEFRERTFLGALLTIACVIVCGYLLFTEVSYYRRVEREDHFVVDVDPHGHNSLVDITLDITFPAIPCDIISVDVRDAFGESKSNLIDHDIILTHLAADGTPIPNVARRSAPIGSPDKKADGKDVRSLLEVPEGYCGSCYGAEDQEGHCCNTCDQVRLAYQKKGWSFSSTSGVEQCVRERVERMVAANSDEGCNVAGRVSVAKIAGNILISPGKTFISGGHQQHDFTPVEVRKFNTTHVVNEFLFGRRVPGLRCPLEGHKAFIEAGTAGVFQYYVKVVPSTFAPLRALPSNSGGKKMPTADEAPGLIHTHQYSVSTHFKQHKMSEEAGAGADFLPGLFVIYDFSPVRVVIQETQRDGLLHFVLEMCAVIGGVFTVTGMLSAMCYHAQRKIAPKFQ
eukprot:TRINITY_DN70430_c0_g1_i1.p2 TRINITY_DN70430_c0_g1~~TRINITY_DN70430_c0_g1_i1.p2  ORF type:complete len:411 (+),score=106.76 TRINITY_DN70430_c0_g1_i1:78-1310(+)